MTPGKVGRSSSCTLYGHELYFRSVSRLLIHWIRRETECEFETETEEAFGISDPNWMLYSFGVVTTYADGGVTDVHGVVGVGRVDVELQDVVNMVSLYLQRAQALHYSGLAAQQLEQTVGRKTEIQH